LRFPDSELDENICVPIRDVKRHKSMTGSSISVYYIACLDQG
jgi:hypothetical protein